MKDSANIQFTSTPASADIVFLTQKINQSADVLSHYGVISHDEALAKADGSIYTDQLWVHPAHRSMEAVQERRRKRPGYTQNSSCIFLKRSL